MLNKCKKEENIFLNGIFFIIFVRAKLNVIIIAYKNIFYG